MLVFCWIWDGFSTKMPELQCWKPDERSWLFYSKPVQIAGSEIEMKNCTNPGSIELLGTGVLTFRTSALRWKPWHHLCSRLGSKQIPWASSSVYYRVLHRTGCASWHSDTFQLLRLYLPLFLAKIWRNGQNVALSTHAGGIHKLLTVLHSVTLQDLAGNWSPPPVSPPVQRFHCPLHCLRPEGVMFQSIKQELSTMTFYDRHDRNRPILAKMVWSRGRSSNRNFF